MKKFLGKLSYFLSGWTLSNKMDLKVIDKCILICAPHTSNWDFYFTLGAFWQMGIPMKMFIKDAWTKPWYGFFIKALGGIGIDRSQKNNMVSFAANLLQNTNHLYLLNTPEGSRSYAEKWKNGFYYIAKEANVPILLAFADYAKKEAGIEKMVVIENRSLNDVMQEIEDYYKNISAKFPENYNPKIY